MAAAIAVANATLAPGLSPRFARPSRGVASPLVTSCTVQLPCVQETWRHGLDEMPSGVLTESKHTTADHHVAAHAYNLAKDDSLGCAYSLLFVLHR